MSIAEDMLAETRTELVARARTALARQGFAALTAAATGRLLGEPAMTSRAWAEFAESYGGLELDEHMGDGGRYRLRRYAAFAARSAGEAPRRLPHRPHYQMLAHNRLNGGTDRWFAPVLPEIADGRLVQAVLSTGLTMAEALEPPPRGDHWDIELHQFRILGRPGQPGLPTPEGLHRDGVDFVFIMLVGRENVTGGRTVVEDEQGHRLAEASLEAPGEAFLLDDRKVRHGVTPILPQAAGQPAWRDVLVVTFRRLGQPG